MQKAKSSTGLITPETMVNFGSDKSSRGMNDMLFSNTVFNSIKYEEFVDKTISVSRRLDSQPSDPRSSERNSSRHASRSRTKPLFSIHATRGIKNKLSGTYSKMSQ